eukprot:9488829-Pyramimonas_sp.AAC.1
MFERSARRALWTSLGVRQGGFAGEENGREGDEEEEDGEQKGQRQVGCPSGSIRMFSDSFWEAVW